MLRSILRKYPRTPHLEGSRIQPGDEDLEYRDNSSLAGRFVVVEEKLDGANCAIGFADDGSLLLQSRGHYLTGGPRERQFALFKSWASRHSARIRAVLGQRYVMYGEWMYAKHTVYYDQLPHYFLEFDVLDRENDRFLATARRRDLLSGLPVVPVPVIWQGVLGKVGKLSDLIGKSRFRGPDWRATLRDECSRAGVDPALTLRQTDDSDLMEGLYLKVEIGDYVVDRVKLVRATFITTILDSGSHWLDRPIIANQLREGVDIFQELL